MKMRELMAGIADVGVLAETEVETITNDSRQVGVRCVFVCL